MLGVLEGFGDEDMEGSVEVCCIAAFAALKNKNHTKVKLAWNQKWAILVRGLKMDAASASCSKSEGAYQLPSTCLHA
jgi:hypothetical protein